MYYPVQIPRLSMDLVKRLYPLCRRLQIPMEQFVSEALAQCCGQGGGEPGAGTSGKPSRGRPDAGLTLTVARASPPEGAGPADGKTRSGTHPTASSSRPPK